MLYARYGPSVVRDCPFATPGDIDAERTYLFFALPSLLAPHLLHCISLGIATSGFLSGKEGSRWRTWAAIGGVILGAAEVWLIANYDNTHNARSTRIGDVDFVYWKMQVWRGLAIAAIDGVLGWVIWLQATGRAFLSPPSVAERAADHAKYLESLLVKARGLGVLRNSNVRDAGSRKKTDEYWVKEGEVMKNVFEEPEVLEAQRNALKRLDMTRIGREADAYVDTILGNIQVIGNQMMPG